MMEREGLEAKAGSADNLHLAIWLQGMGMVQSQHRGVLTSSGWFSSPTGSLSHTRPFQ